MSRTNIETLQAAFERIHGMLVKFTEVCPDEVWEEKFGGFPVWQQAFHAFGCYDFFVRSLEGTPTALAFGEKEDPVLMFQESPKPLTQAELRDAAKKAKILVDSYIASLKSDEELANKHLGLSARLDAPFSHLAVLDTLVGHGYYHLGSCDAALRQHGLEGVF